LSADDERREYLDLVHAVRSATAVLTAPPTLRVSIDLRATDETEAARLEQTALEWRAWLHGMLDEAGNASLDDRTEIAERVRRFLDTVQIEQSGDRVEIGTDMAAVGPLVAVAVQEMRASAASAARMSNVRQIAHVIYVFYGQKGNWPDSLSQAVAATDAGPAILKSTRRPELEVAYEYVRPVGKQPNSLNVMLYEKYDTWPDGGINVGFLDGHVEIRVDQARFEQELEATRARYAEAAAEASGE
jgi:prepilin-type processing-associated H-X9-DG protein